MKGFFSYNGRLNRQPYFWYGLLILVIFSILIVIFQHVSTLLVRVLDVLDLVVASFLVVKRLHDLNRPGWHYWLLIIPLYNIYLGLVLIFQKGTVGPNPYGEDPLGQTPQTPAPAMTPPTAQ